MKKTCKKILSAVLALSLVITLFVSVPVIAHPSSAALVPAVGESVLLDFNYSSGVAFKGTYDFGNGIKLTHCLPDWVNKVEQTNQYLELGKKAAGTRSRFTIVDENWQTSNLTKDRYLTEFRFKLNELTPIENLFKAELCAAFGSIDWAASSPYVWAGVVASGSKYYLKTSDTTITGVPLQAGIWYNVKFDINIKEKKFDFYLDGALKAVNKRFTSNGSEFNKQTGKQFNASTDSAEDKLSYWNYLEYAGIEFPNKFNRIFNYQDDANTPNVCFDDLRVYREPTGVFTYGADDFSNYTEDIVYNGSKIYPSFAGMAVRTDAHRQSNFTIDHENEYVISGTGMTTGDPGSDGMHIRSNLFDAAGALYKPGYYKENSLVTGFKITPMTESVGKLSFCDNLASQYGIEVEFRNKSIFVKYGKTGKITASDYRITKTIGSYEVGKTYDVKICIDLNRSFEQIVTDRSDLKRTLPGICDIYINGEHALSNAPLGYQGVAAGDTPAEGLGNILLRTNSGCQAYFDDLRVYYDEKEEVLSRLIVDMQNAYENGVVSSDTINLPSSYTLTDRNTYKIDWTASNAVIDTATGAVNKSRGGNVGLTAKVYYEGEEDYNLTHTFNMYVTPDLGKNITPVDYEINSVTFADADSAVVYGPADGGKLTGISVKKNAETAADLYAVVYENGVLTGCDVAKNFASGDLDFDIAVNANSEVMFFVWANDGSIKPLASPFEVQKASRKLFILSDSIYDETPPETQPSTGVGLALKSVYNQNNLEIVNLAKCGATLKTFAMSGKFASALSRIERGDYVLISFCHNDQKWPTYVDTAEPLDADGVPSYEMGSYEFYLEEYIEAIRLKGGIPVIATSVPRWEFDGDTPTSTHGNYYNAARNVANYTKVPLLDVYAEAIADMTELGAEASKAYYLEPVDENGDGVYDKTHMTEAGAAWVAGIIADLADSLKLPFSAYRISE